MAVHNEKVYPFADHVSSVPSNLFTGTAAPRTTNSYDLGGNVLVQTGPNGRVTDGYNANNQLTRVIDGAGNTATSNHDSVGI